MNNDISQFLFSIIYVSIGAIITFLGTFILEKSRYRSELIKTNREKYINELKNYCIIFTKYFRYINALCTSFKSVLKKEIQYKDWMGLSGRLNELEIDEMELLQNLYFSKSDLIEFKITAELLKSRTIITDYENIDYIIANYNMNEYELLYKKFIELGNKHYNEAIGKLKKELN